tara:strand:- start:27 stop:695 length:669 start_codon:yes stop_codon:yes gene_type:complete
MREKYVYFQDKTRATKTIGELTLTAVDNTAKGNLISIAIPESGTNGQVTVTVSGNAITAAIGTADDQHAEDIRDAINADAAASALVTATASGTTAITAAVSQTFLADGEKGSAFPLSSFAGMHPVDNDSLRLYFKSMKNFDGTTSGANEVVKSDHVTINTVGTDSDGTKIRETMNSICKAFNSARARSYDIVIGDDRGDGTQYINSELINDLSAFSIADANS